MSVVTPTIFSSGKVIDPTFTVLTIDVIREVNRITNAQLTLADGSIAEQRFEISNADTFEPGKEIEIKLRYEGEAEKEETVFKGVVVKHSVEVDSQGSLLTVDLKDPAVKMTQVRHSEVFREQSDAQVISAIVEKNELEIDIIEDTQPLHTAIIQYNCSDWDFLMSRAEVQGLLVVTDNGRLSAQRISLTGQPLYKFEYGMTGIDSFLIEADALSQRSGITSNAWNIAEQSLNLNADAKDFNIAQGNLKGDQLAKTLGIADETLIDPVPLDQAELQAWADARLIRSRMALIRGRMTVAGIADLKPMMMIEIAGIGERFNGNVLVTGVRHRVGSQGWLTDVQFGLSPDCFCKQLDIADVPAAGLLPPINGLRIGVVAPFEDDPSGELRVKTLLPGLGAEGNETLWARLATPDAGQQHGHFFWPEPGDEVVVGFFNNDPRQAVILGAMFSSHNEPPADISELNEENSKKGWVTKSGLKIELVDVDDQKAQVLIETPAANKILLDDDAQSIVLTDQHGNSIEMNSYGISIKSTKDLTIEASSGKIEIIGNQVDIK